MKTNILYRGEVFEAEERGEMLAFEYRGQDRLMHRDNPFLGIIEPQREPVPIPSRATCIIWQHEGNREFRGIRPVRT